MLLNCLFQKPGRHYILDFFFLLISVAFFFHSMFWNVMLQDSSGVKNLIAFEGLNIYMCI